MRALLVLMDGRRFLYVKLPAEFALLPFVVLYDEMAFLHAGNSETPSDHKCPVYRQTLSWRAAG